ncbi:MAG TPA: E3 binding domain-containing protein [Trueperaceae bacterium]|nr:E3 binding domain-containing protein [Trueperaceae bacterium]
MSEPDITALARRLAEQNNVDWRALSGSGDGGRIVERDVLDYLARVMAGEEALDPTPEPLPDGMETWPDQDPELRAAGQATTLGELRQEIGSAVRDEPLAPMGGGHESVASVSDVDEDVFLFDDDPASEGPGAESQAPETGARPGAVSTSDDLEDLLVAGDDAGLLSDDDDLSGGADVYGAEAAQADEDAFSADLSGGSEEVDGAQWGEGIALGGSGHSTDEEAPDIWGEPLTAPEPDLDLFSDTVKVSESDDMWSQESASETTEAEAEPEVQAGTSLDGWSTDGSAQADHDDTGVHVWEPQEETAPARSQEETSPDWGQAEPTETELTTPQQESGGFDGLPLARTGTVLRRHVDVTALAGAQLAVSQELGFEEPLGAGPFVLRAVAKAARDQGVGHGQVALATFDGGLVLRRVDDAAGRAFSELVNELTGSGQVEDEAGLVVADLSGLDVDEVVLDVDLPVVSLGRMLYDNQRGGYRSTLTLTGDLPAEQGARLLSRVAELLDAPIRLVM